MPYGITQCYLPPGRGDFPAFTPAKAGTRFSDPKGMQSSVDLGGGYFPYSVVSSFLIPQSYRLNIFHIYMSEQNIFIVLSCRNVVLRKTRTGIILQGTVSTL